MGASPLSGLDESSTMIDLSPKLEALEPKPRARRRNQALSSA
jgi:hypothetical protein